jgi:WD40 repeat protein
MIGHASQVNSLSFSPDGQAIATASSDQSIRLWRSKSADQWAVPGPGEASVVDTIVLDGHGSWVWDVVFSEAAVLYSASEDRTARKWTIDDESMAIRLCELVDRATSPDGSAEPHPERGTYEDTCSIDNLAILEAVD